MKLRKDRLGPLQGADVSIPLGNTRKLGGRARDASERRINPAENVPTVM